MCCYPTYSLRWSEWRWRRGMGHWGAGGENPLQLLGHGHQCGGATYYRSTCNLHNLVLSQLMIKRNTKLKRSLTPGSGGARYGTWLSSLGGCAPIICGSPTLMSMPQQL